MEQASNWQPPASDSPVKSALVTFLLCLSCANGLAAAASAAAAHGSAATLSRMAPAAQARLLTERFTELYERGAYREALPLARRALDIRQASFGAAHPETIESLQNLAVLYRALGDYRYAEPLAQRALTLCEQTYGAGHPETAVALNGLGNLYRNMGAYDQAMPLFERALAIAEASLGLEHAKTGIYLANLALLHGDMQAPEQAIPLMARALKIAESAQGPAGASAVSRRRTLLRYYVETGNYASALPLAAETLRLTEDAHGLDALETGAALAWLGMLQYQTGNYGEALPLYRRALSILKLQKGPEHPDTLSSLHNLAKILVATGDRSGALPIYQQIIAIYEKTAVSAPEPLATSLDSLAGLYHLDGDYARALPLYLRVLALTDKGSLRRSATRENALNGLATLYQDMGDTTRALPLLEQTLVDTERRVGPEHPDTATRLYGLARARLEAGEPAAARSLLERALQIAEHMEGPESASAIAYRSGLAHVLDVSDDVEGALLLQQRVVAVTKKLYGTRHRETARALAMLGRLQGRADDPQALLTLRQVLGIAMEQTADPELLAAAFNTLADFHLRKLHPELAILYGKQAVNVLQRQRSMLAGMETDLQGSYLRKNEDIYLELAAWLVDAGRLAEARAVMGMLKEQELYEYMQGDDTFGKRNARIQWTDFEQSWAGRLDDQAARLRQVEGKQEAQLRDPATNVRPPGDEPSSARADLDALLDNLDLAFIQLAPAQVDEVSQLNASTSRLQQAQLREQGNDAVLLTVVSRPETLRLILTTPDNQLARTIAVPAAERMRSMLAFRSAIEGRERGVEAPARRLYDWLIAPFETELDAAHARTLVFSLDGSWRYLPMAALHDGQRWLIERFGVALQTDAAAPTAKAARTSLWRIEAFGITRRIDGFSALQGVRAEIDGIVGPVFPGRARFDEDFTAAILQASLLERPPILHLASHFVFLPGTDRGSYLLLGDGDRLSLASLRQPAWAFRQLDLLTLSACETAMGGGRSQQGREIEGFAALAQRNGARTVLATLWPVEDLSTARLMQAFYRGHLVKQASMAEALRQAQLYLLRGDQAGVGPHEAQRAAKRIESDSDRRQPSRTRPAQIDLRRPYAHPYFWAPFVMLGDWR